jgi:hypothetical protein
MASNRHPLLRLRRRNGRTEELVFDPCAIRLFLGVAIVVALMISEQTGCSCKHSNRCLLRSSDSSELHSIQA